MNDKFIFLVAMGFSALIVLSPVACTVHKNTMKKEAIEAGADPIMASCAMDIQPDRIMCAVRAAAKE